MHIFFSGIGGAGIGPLALIALQAGYKVTGSDKQHSQYIDYLHSKGITNIHIGQTTEKIETVHKSQPIDWFVYSGALPRENPQHPELLFCQANNIRTSKRDELLNVIITDKNLKLIAVAGTHGKTTTTAMIVWLFHCLNIPISYSFGAKTSFSDSGHFESSGSYFVYECDEFDRNFLAFEPYISTLTSVTWDHHDIYPTKESYKEAFAQFINQSAYTFAWDTDIAYIGTEPTPNIKLISPADVRLDAIGLLGLVNRQNALEAVLVVERVTHVPQDQLLQHINTFPGLSRRFEQISDHIFSDYAHNAEKVRGAIEIALEHAKNVVVVYEGLHNRRQHFMLKQGQFTHLFDGAKKVYWVPSYLGREDPNLPLLSPQELIGSLADPKRAEAAELNITLRDHIDEHVAQGDLVVCLSGGGGHSLDEWLRGQYIQNA